VYTGVRGIIQLPQLVEIVSLDRAISERFRDKGIYNYKALYKFICLVTYFLDAQQKSLLS